MTIRRAKAFAVRAALALTGVTVLATGCFAGGQTPGSNGGEDDDEGGPGTEASAEAGEILERYGIALPGSASTPEVEPLPENEGREEGYRLTFTLDPSEAEQLCADINGPLPAPSLTESEAEVFGLEEPPEGAQLCSGSQPEQGRQQIRVLYAGDPSEVTLALYLMPAR